MMRTIRNPGNRRPASAQAPIRTRAHGVDLATLALGAALVALLALLVPVAHAQGSRKDDIVFGPGGHPVAGATVTVCQASATGTPCAPLATLYTDATLTVPAANPLQTDGIGNYHFYAAAGRYVVQISGPGISATLTYRDVILASDVSSSGSGNNISAFGLTLGGNLSVAGNAAVNGTLAVGGSMTFSGPLNINAANTGNVAGKSALADAVQYVTPEGNDANDGLSWGTAKFTVFGACEALPGGAASPPTCGNGTIYFTDQSHSNPTAGAGLWLMGGNDPNYASPPAGWLRATSSGSLNVIGVGSKGYGPQPHKGKAYLFAGNNTDLNHPGVWLSAISGAMRIANLAIFYPGRAYVVGECSDHTRTNTCNSSGVTFENTTGTPLGVAGNGPCFDITGASFWIWLKDFGCSGLDTINAPGDDKSAALLIDGRGNSGNGLIFINDANTANGGIKLYAGVNGGQVNVDGLTTEGQWGEAAVWIALSGLSGDTAVMANVFNVQVADANVLDTPAFQNDIPETGPQMLVSNAQFGPIVGPATVLNQSRTNYLLHTISPLREGQTGFFNGHVYGATDLTARQFAPSAVRFTNLATTAAASWTNSGSTTFTTGITAPDGTTGAGQFVSTSGVQAGILRPQTSMTLATGDYLVAGAWVRSQTANGYMNNGVPIQFTGWAGATKTCTYDNFVVAGDGQWDWITVLCKILTAPANPYFIGLAVNYNTTNAIQAYAPILVYIPTGTISENEVYAYAAALVPYDKTCVVGTTCSLIGQNRAFIEGTPSGAGAGTDVCGGDSIAHAMKCSYNNDAFATIPRISGAVTAGHIATWTDATHIQDGGAVSGSGTVTTSGSPAQYQAAVFSSGTVITGVAPTGNSQCFMSAASNFATTNPLFTTCPGGGSGLSGMTAGQIPVAASATTVTSSVATSGSGSVCLTTSCVMTTPNLGTPSAINLTNATSPPTWNQNTTGSAVGITGALFLSNTNLSILGDMMYVNSSPALARLAGNTTSAKQFLTQTGTGTISAVPAWGALASGDIPNNAANTTGTAATITGALALANTPLTTTQDILFDNAGALGRLAIVTSGQCLGNTAGAWASLACSGGGSGTLTATGLSLPVNQIMLGNTYPDTKPLGSLGTTTTVLHGNAAGAPTFGAVALATDVSGQLPIGNVGSAGLSGTSPMAISAAGAISCATCVTGAAALTSNAVVIGGGLQASSTISADTTTTHALFATAGAPAFRALALGDLPSGYVWNNLGAPSGNLSLAMAANTSIFTTTTAQAQMFAWKNTTAATVTTSQGSPVPAICGRAWHASADVEDCITFSELPGNGLDAPITFTIGHTGTSTGLVTTGHPGPIQITGTAGATVAANGLFAFDTTNKNYHGYVNGADSIFLNIPSAPATGDLLDTVVATGNTLAHDSGILTANVVTQASNGASGQIATYTGANKALVAASAIPNGVTATTQAAASADTKLATDAYVDNHFIANGTFTLNTAAAASGACETVVTVAATGVATTDVIGVGFNGDPTAVTGYGASATGAVLSIYAYPTTNNVNVKVCNSTSASITPSAMTLNWKVTR